jgi:hypothetical protein
VSTRPCTDCALSEDELIQLLSNSYDHGNIQRYLNLFPSVEDSAAYRCVVDPPLNGIESWGLGAEFTMQRRMFFTYGGVLPPEPEDWWITSINAVLTRVSPSWLEATDAYRSSANPTGLDPGKWEATRAVFHAVLALHTFGGTTYCVDALEQFVVIRDRSAEARLKRHYFIYRWRELQGSSSEGPGLEACESVTWTTLKLLYGGP